MLTAPVGAAWAALEAMFLVDTALVEAVLEDAAPKGLLVASEVAEEPLPGPMLGSTKWISQRCLRSWLCVAGHFPCGLCGFPIHFRLTVLLLEDV